MVASDSSGSDPTAQNRERQQRLPKWTRQGTLSSLEIADSARKHGIPDEDIRHAVRMALRAVSQDPDRLLLIGPDRAGQLLEVVVLDPDEDPVAIHAMRLRPQFHRYL